MSSASASSSSPAPSPSSQLRPYSTIDSSSLPSPRPPPQSPTKPIPNINLLLLGSPGIGKSTFISQLQHVRLGELQRPPSSSSPQSQPHPSSIDTVPNPSTFSVLLFNRPYTINLYRSISPLFIDPFPNKIDALILAFSVDDRISLFNAQRYWRRVFLERYDHQVDVPVMVLGLRRDLRTAERRSKTDDQWSREEGRVTEDGEVDEFVCIMPEEGLQAARDMQVDRYAECSALTGDLMWEVLEDVTRMAAGTTTENGGFGKGNGECVVL